MRVVIDTNVLLMAIPKISKYRLIFDKLLQGSYTLVISNSIIHEYVEVIGNKTTGAIAQNLGELILSLENVAKVQVHFRWNLIETDPDDNKFVDCALAGRANYIVTNDNHFNHLKQIQFPSIEVLSADDFLDKLK